jgi:hypothetical protein
LRKQTTQARFEPVTATYQTRIAATGIVVEFRHVTAHKGVSTPRNAVNTWCDTECRKLMRLAREAALSGMILVNRPEAEPLASG